MGESRSWPARLLASAACIAAAAGIAVFSYHEIDRWGGGVFPGLCILTAIIFAAAGVGLPFRRARDFMLQAGMILLRLLMLSGG